MDWKQAVIFVIMFLVVQQFEGNVIYPHVVGNSVGLPGMWVLVAVTIGGNVAGVVGMLFSIPLFSVVYQLLTEGVNWTDRKKRSGRNCAESIKQQISVHNNFYNIRMNVQI